MRRIYIIAAAVACLLLIGYATLSSLPDRPMLLGRHESLRIVIFERFVAYLILGFLLSWLFPGRTILICAIVVGIAISLELLQELRPDRDPAALDALEKAAGGIAGVIMARWLALQRRR